MHLPRIRSRSVALHQSEHLDKLTAVNAFGCGLARLSLEASRSPEGAGTIIGGVMKILMALTSHDRLGTPARRPASGWRSSPLPIMSFGMPVPISPWLRPRAGSRRSIPEARNPLPRRRRRTASSRTRRRRRSSPIRRGYPPSQPMTTMLSSIRADTDPCGIWPRIASPSG